MAKIDDSIFPHATEVPFDLNIPQISGSLLLNGKIETTGFAQEGVFAACLTKQ
jgi:hypothetical protein